MNNQGSVLLMVIMLMSSCMVVCMVLWRTTTHVHDLSIARQICKQRAALLHAYMHYALVYCRQYFEELCSREKMCIIHQKRIAKEHAGFSHAILTIEAYTVNSDEIELYGILSTDKAKMKESCILTRSQETPEKPWVYRVRSWNKKA